MSGWQESDEASMISPGRQAMFIFLSFILLSVQESEFKDRSERNGRLAKEGSDGLWQKKQKNQKEERSKEVQKQHRDESHVGTKSENRNLKTEKKRNVRKVGKDIQKKKRKLSSKPRYDKLMECNMIKKWLKPLTLLVSIAFTDTFKDTYI